MAYCAAESNTMLWTSSYLVEARGITKEVAAAFASLFFIGMTVGRFISGFISEKLGDRKMIQIGTSIAILGVVCIFIPVSTDLFALIGFIVMGLGCGLFILALFIQLKGIFDQKIHKQL